MKQPAIIFATLIMILAGHAGVSRADALADCQRGDPDRMIAGCSGLLDAGRLNAADRSKAYNNRGFAYQNKGDQDRAIADYGRAIELDPNNLQARYNRALAYLSGLKYGPAVADLDVVIAHHPENWMAYANRAVAYQGLRVYGRAIADLTKALEIQPNHPLMLNNRAYAYSRKGEPAIALADIRAALALDPDNARFHHSLGEIHFYAGETDRATEAWQTVCRFVSAEQTRTWQRNLVVRGHYTNAVDGVCDDALIDAFRSCAREKSFLHT